MRHRSTKDEMNNSVIFLSRWVVKNKPKTKREMVEALTEQNGTPFTSSRLDRLLTYIAENRDAFHAFGKVMTPDGLRWTTSHEDERVCDWRVDKRLRAGVGGMRAAHDEAIHAQRVAPKRFTAIDRNIDTGERSIQSSGQRLEDHIHSKAVARKGSWRNDEPSLRQEMKIRVMCRKRRIREPRYFTKGEASDIIDKLLGHTS